MKKRYASVVYSMPTCFIRSIHRASVHCDFISAKGFWAAGPVPLADGHKTYAKRTQRTSKISGVAPSVFIRSRNWQNRQQFGERNGIEWTLVVWSGDVKRMIIGSRMDESEWKWMTGVNCEAYMHSGKSGYITYAQRKQRGVARCISDAKLLIDNEMNRWRRLTEPWILMRVETFTYEMHALTSFLFPCY